MFDLILWCVPARAEEVRKIALMLGGAALLGGIIGWLSWVEDDTDLLPIELLGPGF